MKRIISVCSVLLLLSVAMLWHSCDAKVNLNDIDMTVKVDANVALPLGSAKIEIGSLFGDASTNLYVDSLYNRGVLTFKDTFSMSKSFHKVDLASYLSQTTVKMNMYDKLQPYMFGDYLHGTGVTVPIEFPFTLQLNGINHDEDYQRLDRALIKNASFISNIALAGGFDLNWDWIEKISITLGEAFHRAQGDTLVVYDKAIGGVHGYGEDILINVDEFSMNLMKDTAPPTPEAYGYNNVVRHCDFTVTFYVNIPQGESVRVPSTAALNYNLGVRFIDYHAVWGMFKPSDDMQDERVVDLADNLSLLQFFESTRLPFADPKLEMQITTQIAGALMVKGDYLYVQEEGNDPVYATFDGDKRLYRYFNPNEYLPLSSEIGDSATMRILFDKDPARGHIDNLFKVKPDHFGYKFEVDFFRQETPQIRISNNTDIRVDAIVELPLMFNQGVSLALADTIENIDFSALSIDSMLQGLPDVVDTLEEAALTLVLQLENSIPLQIKGHFTCLDENNNVVIDPHSMPVQLIEGDTILLAAPDHKYNQSTASWVVTPAKTQVVVKANQEKLNSLKKVKKLVFHAIIDDESLAYAYEQGYFNVKITEHASIGIKMGIGANLDAVLGLNELFGN